MIRSPIPRIRAFLPERPRLPAPDRAGDAPDVFRTFGRTLAKLERTAHRRSPSQGTGGTTQGGEGA